MPFGLQIPYWGVNKVTESTSSGFPAWNTSTNDIQSYIDALAISVASVTSPSLTASSTTITQAGVYTGTGYVNNSIFINPRTTDGMITLPYNNGNSNTFTYFRTFPGTFSSATFSYISESSSSSASPFYFAGALSNNSNFYVAEANGSRLLRVETPNSLTGTPTVSQVATFSSSSFRGGIRGFNGKIYFANDTDIATFDPTDNSLTYLKHGRGTGTTRWSDAVQAANGKVYFLPNAASVVMVYDPVSATTSTISISSPPSQGYGGAILAQDGYVYGVKRVVPVGSNTDMVIRINPSDDTLVKTGTVSSTYITDAPGGPCCLGADGKIYFMARASSGANLSLYRISVPSMAVEYMNVNNITYLSSDIIWWGGMLQKDGNIWVPFSNYRNNNILRMAIIPTSTTALSLTDNQILAKPVSKILSS